MVIEHYSSGTIVIDGATYTSDVIIWAEGVDDTWWRLAGHRLAKEDLDPILNKAPEILIIGTGVTGAMQVPSEVLEYMRSRCEQVYVEPTERACARYNELCGGPLRVAAGIHLSC